jgi:transposase
LEERLRHRGRRDPARIATAHPHITKAWVDAGYRTTAIDHGARLGVDVHPVHRPPGTRGFTFIPRRWTIERSIGWLMHHRRLARDYETHPHRSEAVIHLAMIDLMARTYTTCSRSARSAMARLGRPR